MVFGEVVAVHIDKSLLKDGIYNTSNAQHIVRGVVWETTSTSALSNFFRCSGPRLHPPDRECPCPRRIFGSPLSNLVMNRTASIGPRNCIFLIENNCLRSNFAFQWPSNPEILVKPRIIGVLCRNL
jgi:hypothetical protein